MMVWKEKSAAGRFAEGNKVAICIIILAVACLWNMACRTQAVYAKTDIKERMDGYLQSSVKNAHIPALSVTIVDKDQVLFAKSYGECHSCDTPFLLGSVSKSFTAVCIMQLAEQGKLRLDDRLEAYLPDAADGGRITIRQLLNHTSGLGEHQTLENYKIVNKQGVHHYANVNYSLLGEVIEASSGRPYRDYITENLFAPLQLSHTAASRSESIENGLIDGYTNYWGMRVKSSHKYPSDKNAWISVPAGYLSSSTNDLGKYLQMYLNGGEGVLSQPSIDTMFYGDTAYVDGKVPYEYGYGWTVIKEPLSEPILRHSGLIETGVSSIFILPESGIGIAVTANVNDYFVTNNMMDGLGWGVVLMLLDSPPNNISGGAYLLRHAWIDLLMFVAAAVAVVSFCLIPGYARKVSRRKSFASAAGPVLCYLLATVFIYLLVPVCFATPLWVAKAFVPDVFWTVAVSCVLYLANAVWRGVVLFQKIH